MIRQVHEIKVANVFTKNCMLFLDASFLVGTTLSNDNATEFSTVNSLFKKVLCLNKRDRLPWKRLKHARAQFFN